tara:strand:+ start:229 stop:468 length:240 start_codon:yes stop_codon:yes gene_type:complete
MAKMMIDLLKSLELDYEAQIKKAQANLKVYMKNPAGIGEHPDLDKAIDSQIAIMANNRDKLNEVKRLQQEWAIDLDKYN